MQRSRLSDKVSVHWCPEGDLNSHSPFGPADFKSAASADFAIRASCSHRIRIADDSEVASTLAFPSAHCSLWSASGGKPATCRRPRVPSTTVDQHTSR
jgi:hypothetical protein